MTPIEQHLARQCATTLAFRRKLERSMQIIRQAIQTIEHPYLAFSGGIDSTALLSLLRECGYRDVPLLWGDDGYDYPETLDFLATFPDLVRVRCLHPWSQWCREMSRPDLASDPQARAAWGNPQQWQDSWQDLKEAREHGYSGVFLGLLACESRSRGYALQKGWHPLYQVKSEAGMWHCSPLAHWTKLDVWSYVISRGIVYNPVYDALADLNIAVERRRVAPLTCFRVMQYGSHAILKEIAPEMYNRLCAWFPDVRNY